MRQTKTNKIPYKGSHFSECLQISGNLLTVEEISEVFKKRNRASLTD